MQGLPKAPTGLTAVVQPNAGLPAGSQVALAWTNNATNATNVVVERAVGAGAFSVLATLAPTDVSYMDTAVVPGNYTYRVNAINAVGPSAYSNTAPVTVPFAASATALTSSLNPSTFGDSVTFTATVTAVAATAIPSGNVDFAVDGVPVGTAALDPSGVATVTTSALAAGSRAITASYLGDTIFATSSGSLTQTVNQAATTTTVGSNINPSVAGQSVTFTATVSPAAAGGAVNFSIDGAIVAGGPYAINASGQATYSTAGLAVGAHPVVAIYAGSPNYAGSSSATLTQTVGTLLRTSTTTVTSNRVPTANLGQNITFTAAVAAATAPATPVPTGTVQFSIDGVNAGGAVALNALGRATFATNTLTAGSHNVVATYSGSIVYAGGISATYVQVVNQANSTTTLTRNVNPSVFGQSVTFTARVTPAAATGSVQFYVDGAAVGGPVALDATGRARLVTSALAVGISVVRADYLGSVNYRVSNASVTQTVNKATSRTVVTTSGSPAPRNTPVTLTATVTAVAPGIGVATGNVQFYLDGVIMGGPVALNGAGQAAFATSTIPVGRHIVTAVYAGDGNFNTSTSGNRVQRIL